MESARKGSVNVVLPNTVINGRVTVAAAGTRVTLSANFTNLEVGVFVKALSTNTGLIYLGNSTVAAANGYVLSVNEHVFISIRNLQNLFIDASINAQGISYIAH